MQKLLLLIFLLSATLLAKGTYVKPLFILASSNLKFVFPQLLQEFYNSYPESRVYIEYGSSGYLADRIFNNKKYDIFFSANREYPQQVYMAQKSVTPAKDYAQGILILFVPSNPLLATKRIKILKDPNIKNITIANRATAPYGMAAIQVLKSCKCYDTIYHKIRYSTDVATVIDSVIWHKNAGFLPKSALSMLPEDKRREGVDYIEIDERLYTPIIQSYTLSKTALENPNTTKFLNFIESKVGQAIFRENGYKNIH